MKTIMLLAAVVEVAKGQSSVNLSAIGNSTWCTSPNSTIWCIDNYCGGIPDDAKIEECFTDQDCCEKPGTPTGYDACPSNNTAKSSGGMSTVEIVLTSVGSTLTAVACGLGIWKKCSKPAQPAQNRPLLDEAADDDKQADRSINITCCTIS